jgi:hypothetical protein
MRHVLITAAALAACGFLASTTANAQMRYTQMPYEPGGPAQVGNMCKVPAGTYYWPQQEAFGHYAPCASGAYAEAPAVRKHRR